MILLILSMKIIISLIFISSAVSKIFNFTEHIIVIRKYNIIPNHLVKLFAYLEIMIELSASVLLLFSSYVYVSSMAIILLLMVYTFALTINLTRGNTDLSCGCSGVLGNHAITWWLPIRNIFMIVTLVMIIAADQQIVLIELFFSFETIRQISFEDFLSTILASILLVMFYAVFNHLITLSSVLEKILKGEVE